MTSLQLRYSSNSYGHSPAIGVCGNRISQAGQKTSPKCAEVQARCRAKKCLRWHDELLFIETILNFWALSARLLNSLLNFFKTFHLQRVHSMSSASLPSFTQIRSISG